MAFTDKDLKRLKDSLHKFDQDCNEFCQPSCGQLSALLARLALSEIIADLHCAGRSKGAMCPACEAWRKSAGK